MNVFTGFSPSHYFLPTDGKVAVALAGWLLSRLEAIQVVLSKTNTAGTMAPVSWLKADPPPSFRRDVTQH